MPRSAPARKPDADDGDGRVRDRAQRGGGLGRVRREQRRGRGGGRREHQPLALDEGAVGGGHAPAAASVDGIGAISAARATRRRLPSAGASAAGSSPRPSGNETGRPSPRPPRFRRISARRTLPCSRSIAATRGRALRTDSAAASPAKTPISAGAAARVGGLAPETPRDEGEHRFVVRAPRATNGSTKSRSLRARRQQVGLEAAPAGWRETGAARRRRRRSAAAPRATPQDAARKPGGVDQRARLVGAVEHRLRAVLAQEPVAALAADQAARLPPGRRVVEQHDVVAARGGEVGGRQPGDAAADDRDAHGADLRPSRARAPSPRPDPPAPR